MLQYALIHLYGLGLEMNDLKNFRQLNSLTPGHPEVGHTRGSKSQRVLLDKVLQTRRHAPCRSDDVGAITQS